MGYNKVAGDPISAAEFNSFLASAGLFAVSATGSDAYAITVTPAPNDYDVGDKFIFKADVANTGAATLNVNGLGAKTIKQLGGTEDLISNQILAGQLVTVIYDGTNFQMVSAANEASSVAVRRVYTANDTWNKPAGLKYIEVEVQAGGGGGGSGNTSGSRQGGSGGGGGGYSRKIIVAASLGATETVTVGAAGAGGVYGVSSGAGSDGGTSSFGAHLSATGGQNGIMGGGPNAGGTGTGGDVNIDGQAAPLCPSGFLGSTGSSDTASGEGGDSQLGKGGRSVWLGTAVGENAVGYGGGGSGGSKGQQNGGNGTQGIVIVTEYYNP